MLDLIITYLNFFIIAIKYIVKIIAFQPPEPKGYRIKYFKNEAEENNNRLELKSGDIIEILFALPNKSQNLKKTNDKSNEIKNEDKNKEIIIKRKQKYEYKPATNIYSSYELKYIVNEDNNTIIPAFLFKAYHIGLEPHNIIKDYLVIYCHGNSGDIGTSFMECQYLSYNLSCNVLCFEYPGYGLSTDINNTNEKRAYFNIRQAYKYARYELKYKPENIIIYGFSLGTGVAFDLACDKNYPIGGVILQSAFLSIIRTIYNFKKTYYFDLFNNCDKAKYCNSKIYFIHGDKDSIVPYVHGRILSKLIPKQYFCGFYTVPGANHNDILKFAKRNLYEMIINFINSLTEDNLKNPDVKSSDSELSFNKIISEKPNNYKNEFDIRINYDLNEINNITSEDKLNDLQREKGNNKNLFNEMQASVKNSIKNYFEKNKDNENSRKEEEKNDEEKLKNENEKNGAISKKMEEDSKIEEPKYLDSKDIKLNIDNHNNIMISKTKEISNNSKFNKINSENSKSSDSNELSISFDKK